MTKELTPQREIFLETYFAQIKQGKSRSAAAEEAKRVAGYSENTWVSKILISLSDEIVARSIQELAMVLPRAVHRVEKVLDDPMQEGSRTILEAAASIMDRAGVVKRNQTDVTVKQPDGLIVLPPKNKEE